MAIIATCKAISKQTCKLKIQTPLSKGSVLEGLCDQSVPRSPKESIFPLGSPLYQLQLQWVALFSEASWDLSRNMGLFDCSISLSSLWTSCLIALFKLLSYPAQTSKGLDWIQWKGRRNKKSSTKPFDSPCLSPFNCLGRYSIILPSSSLFLVPDSTSFWQGGYIMQQWCVGRQM